MILEELAIKGVEIAVDAIRDAAKNRKAALSYATADLGRGVQQLIIKNGGPADVEELSVDVADTENLFFDDDLPVRVAKLPAGMSLVLDYLSVEETSARGRDVALSYSVSGKSVETVFNVPFV